MRRNKNWRSTWFWPIVVVVILWMAPITAASDDQIPSDLHWTLVKALLLSEMDRQTNAWEVPYYEPVLPLLREGDPYIRAFAAYALGEAKCYQAVDDLIVLLGSDDMHLRHIAARALGKIGDPKAVMPLIEVLCRQEEAAVVQSAAALALGRLGDPRASRILAYLSLTEEGMLRHKSVSALARLKARTEQKLAKK